MNKEQFIGIRQFLFRNKWSFLGLGSLLFFQVFIAIPYIVELFYFGIVFRIIRTLWDYTIGFVPFPLLYLLITILILSVYIKIKSSRKSHSFRQKLMGVSNFIGGTLFFFYWLWGFNYARIPLQTKLHLDNTNVDARWILSQLEKTVNNALIDRVQFISSTDSIDKSYIPKNLENDIRKSAVDVFDELALQHFGRVRVKRLYPSGLLLHISTAGIYIPFVSEGYVDPGLHPISIPFTMAHEMTHGYGVTNEGECNFMAYLICINSSDPFIRYSGEIGFFRYLLFSAQRAQDKDFAPFRKNLNRSLVNDLQAISNASNRYPDILPRLRNLIYDNYLKTQGIKEGMVSYSHIIQLVHAYAKKENHSLLR